MWTITALFNGLLSVFFGIIKTWFQRAFPSQYKTKSLNFLFKNTYISSSFFSRIDDISSYSVMILSCFVKFILLVGSVEFIISGDFLLFNKYVMLRYAWIPIKGYQNEKNSLISIRNFKFFKFGLPPF